LPEQHTKPAQCANAELHQAHAASAQHFFDIDPQPGKLLAIQENTAFLERGNGAERLPRTQRSVAGTADTPGVYT
jgi:hypothetical protein